ncbi:MAG: hypothetical protein PVH22_01385, partial [Desulfobacteraceae bacterium]
MTGFVTLPFFNSLKNLKKAAFTDSALVLVFFMFALSLSAIIHLPKQSRSKLMDSKSQWSRLLRLALVGVLVTFGALTVATPVHATENYLSLWRSAYPDSASADNLESSCTLCHAGSRSEFNGY